MRFKITLELMPQESGREIPINYQYELSSVIYRIVANADEKYSEMLHNIGFISTTKHFKLFTFSNLIVPNRGIRKETERLVIKSDMVYWYLGFIPNEITQKFVQGVFADQQFRLADSVSGAWFKIREIQLLPDVEVSAETEFETLSPICVSTRVDGRKTYMKPGDETYEQGLLTGLLERYKAINGIEFDGDKYCHLTVTNEPKSALIKIKSGTKDETKVRGFRYRFKIDLPQPLYNIACNGGLGEACSMGFGMINVKEER